MTTFVVGHGTLSAKEPKTIVPPETQIGFWTAVDLKLLRRNGMAAVWSGDAGNAAETYYSGDQLPNYRLTPLADHERAAYETVAQEGLSVWYVGGEDDEYLPGPIHLCEDTQGLCKAGYKHECDGVFGRIRDNEIIYLACRLQEGWIDEGQYEYGGTGQTTVNDTFRRMYDILTKMPEDDCIRYLAALEATRDPDDQEQLAFLMTYDELRKPIMKYRTAEFLEVSDPLSFEAFFFGQPERERGWMREVAGVTAALQEAERHRKEQILQWTADLLKQTDPEMVGGVYDSRSSEEQAWMREVPGLEDFLSIAELRRMDRNADLERKKEEITRHTTNLLENNNLEELRALFYDRTEQEKDWMGEVPGFAEALGADGGPPSDHEGGA